MVTHRVGRTEIGVIGADQRVGDPVVDRPVHRATVTTDTVLDDVWLPSSDSTVCAICIGAGRGRGGAGRAAEPVSHPAPLPRFGRHQAG